MRTRWLSAAIATVIAAGLFLFQPWRLFTVRDVQDVLPAVTGPSAPAADATPVEPVTPTRTTARPTARVLAAGTFVSHEHDTRGRAELVRLPDGGHRLLLRDLLTSDGPDLRVWLTDRPVIDGRAGWRVFDDGRWVELARLKGNRGNQLYDVPAASALSELRSVTIWCRRFSVSFGAAPLDKV